MNDEIRFEAGATNRAAANISGLTGGAGDQVTEFKSVLSQVGACWGADQYGAVFGANYLPAATDAAIGVLERSNQLNQLATALGGTAKQQAQTESDAEAAAREIAT